MKRFVLPVFIALLAASCSTDVDLNAPYKKTTVVYGLLNSDENGDGVTNALDTQWIKINKTFLGSGDNIVYAGIRDSSEYKDEDFVKKVVQQIHDGQIVNEFELVSKEVSNKQTDGIFYAPLQTVYYFIPPATGLAQADNYKILLQFTDGREVSATTNLINYSQFMWQSPQAGSSLNLARTNSVSMITTYNNNVTVKWYPALNADIYEASLRFHYTEYTYDNPQWTGVPLSAEEKYLDFNIGSTSKDRTTPSGHLELYFNGQAFYTYVESKLEKNPSIRRQIGKFTDGKTRCFELRLNIGNDILADYISVNTPSTGIVQEKPIYTNVSNGLGLFAGRGTKILKDIPLVSTNNNGAVLTGNLDAFFLQGIVDLNFCDPNPASDYACGQ